MKDPRMMTWIILKFFEILIQSAVVSGNPLTMFIGVGKYLDQRVVLGNVYRYIIRAMNSSREYTNTEEITVHLVFNGYVRKRMLCARRFRSIDSRDRGG